MADAARVIQDLGADICDINMGMSVSKKVCAHSGGSALMKDPILAAQIVREVRAAIQIPSTVKMRSWILMENEEMPLNFRKYVNLKAQRPLRFIGVQEETNTVTNVDMIARAKDNVKILAIANGDIVDIPSTDQMHKDTGCDGFMVGRGMLKNPWCLLEMSAYLNI